eukprot:TRINITY_DN25911_c0_g1_i1.p1 TRINITY_DN25911_c0_g1~~TRINITY_DN25911_c0_g1_i1.p1  ORF type:complete len:498 (+),score=64.40 TRINITY_DN25911_c0_g1_i1:34-1527(+)
MLLVSISREPSLEASLASYASDDLLVSSLTDERIFGENRKRAWSCPPTDSEILESEDTALLPSLVSDRESEDDEEITKWAPGLNIAAVAFTPAPKIPDTMYPTHIPIHATVTTTDVNITYMTIEGRAIDTCRSPEGCKILQSSIPCWSSLHVEGFFWEIASHVTVLMRDTHGSHVIQRLVESSSPVVRSGLVECVRPELAELSLQPFSCRMIQKILEALPEDECVRLSRELDGHVLRCVQDQHGNHVVQRFIDLIPQHCDFIMQAFFGKVLQAATHSYGCRVVQRILEKCRDTPDIMKILEEILHHVHALSLDQYGNYVVQHVVKHGHPQYQYALAAKLAPSLCTITVHKFASNVVEKLIENVASSRLIMIQELSKPCPADHSLSALASAAMDPFGNYVIQKLFEYSSDAQKGMMHSHLQPFIPLLSRSHHSKNLQQKLKLMTSTMGAGNGGGSSHGRKQQRNHGGQPRPANSAYVNMPMPYPTLPHAPIPECNGGW